MPMKWLVLLSALLIQFLFILVSCIFIGNFIFKIKCSEGRMEMHRKNNSMEDNFVILGFNTNGTLQF
ncbi:hypothetical protein E2320_016454, partial [Naja naja]